VRRKLLKGERSVSVIQGDALEIYCDVTGVSEEYLRKGRVRVLWSKGTAKKCAQCFIVWIMSLILFYM